jgi:hypothetical protein
MGLTSPIGGMSMAQASSLTPFGFAAGVVNGIGPGSIQIGPMGVSSSLVGPVAIDASNTVNRLGAASPFAPAVGLFDTASAQTIVPPIGGPATFVGAGFVPQLQVLNPLPNQTNPMLLPGSTMGINPQAVAGGFAQSLVPQQALGGTAFGGSALIPQQAPGGTALGGNSFGAQLWSQLVSNWVAQMQQMQSGLAQWMGQFGFSGFTPSLNAGFSGTGLAGNTGGISLMPTAGGGTSFAGNAFPVSALSGTAGIAGGVSGTSQMALAGMASPQQAGMAWVPVQVGGGQTGLALLPQFALAGSFGGTAFAGGFGGSAFSPQQGIAGGIGGSTAVMPIGIAGTPTLTTSLMGQPMAMTPMMGLGGSNMGMMVPLQALGGSGMMNGMPNMTPTPMMGMPTQTNPTGSIQVPPQLQNHPIVQQFMAQRNFGGTAGLLVSPLGTFVTAISPVGGTANAGFLGTQAAGGGMSLVLHPLNPAMIVGLANPFYSRFNFNQGFFSA